MDLDDEIYKIIYEVTKIATKEAISMGYLYEEFRDLQHLAVVMLMIDEGCVFEDYARFRNEVENNEDLALSEEEWNKVLAKAGDRMQNGGREMTDEERLKLIDAVTASLKDKDECVE